jgi:hypothetical protein
MIESIIDRQISQRKEKKLMAITVTVSLSMSADSDYYDHECEGMTNEEIVEYLTNNAYADLANHRSLRDTGIGI